MRIVEADLFARLEKLLHNKVANGGPKKLAKGTKLSKDYLHSIEHHQWFDIRVADDDVAAQIEASQGRFGAEAYRVRCRI